MLTLKFQCTKPLLLLLLILASYAYVEAEASSYHVESWFRFPKPGACIEDTTGWVSSEKKLKRWTRDMDFDEHAPENMNEERLPVRDLSQLENVRLGQYGFERVMLSAPLLPIFERIGEKGVLDSLRVGPTLDQLENEVDEAEMPVEELLGRRLQGLEAFQLQGHGTYNFRCSGFVIRKGGPMGVKLVSDEHKKGYEMVAQRVHIDQDLEGEPLARMGLTWLFNSVPFVYLVNVWVPLAQPKLRPLGLMDIRSLEDEDVVRYRANSTKTAGGKLGSFVSDRKMVVHSDGQEWFWFSDMTFGEALVFYTGETAHASFSLPGEEDLKSVFDDTQGLLDSMRDDGTEIDVKSICKREIPTLSSTLPYLEELFLAAVDVRKKFCESSAAERHSMKRLLEGSLKSMSRSSLEIRCATLIVPYGLFYAVLGAVTVAVCMSLTSVVHAAGRLAGFTTGKQKEE